MKKFYNCKARSLIEDHHLTNTKCLIIYELITEKQVFLVLVNTIDSHLQCEKLLPGPSYTTPAIGLSLSIWQPSEEAIVWRPAWLYAIIFV